MFIVDATATGEDNVLTNKSSDLLFRKQQLERLQEEVVDIEDMSGGISIMDLGLNEFRLDLLEYIKTNPDFDKTPYGLHSVVNHNDEFPKGVIFILKNLNKNVNVNKQNRLHPFYMLYIDEQGEIVINYLFPKYLNPLNIIFKSFSNSFFIFLKDGGIFIFIGTPKHKPVA
jgi:hypothetical protein